MTVERDRQFAKMRRAHQAMVDAAKETRRLFREYADIACEKINNESAARRPSPLGVRLIVNVSGEDILKMASGEFVCEFLANDYDKRVEMMENMVILFESSKDNNR